MEEVAVFNTQVTAVHSPIRSEALLWAILSELSDINARHLKADRDEHWEKVKNRVSTYQSEIFREYAELTANANAHRQSSEAP